MRRLPWQSKTAMAVYNNRGQPDETSYTGTQLSTGQTIYTEQVPGGPVVDYYYNGDEAVVHIADRSRRFRDCWRRDE